MFSSKFVFNFSIVSKINVAWSCLPAFSYPDLQFKLERSLTKKLKLKHLDGVMGTLRLFGILKIRGFVFVRIRLILLLQ